MTLLAFSLVLEGVLTTVPHQHHAPKTTRTLCDKPSCPAPASAHLGQPEIEGRNHLCLACSIQSTSFAAIGWFHGEFAVAIEFADLFSFDVRLSPPRRWAEPLRGPPVFA